MAKKIKDLDRLKTEIALQKSKLQSLQLLHNEVTKKVQRLELQKKQIEEKAAKLSYAIQQNESRLNGKT